MKTLTNLILEKADNVYVVYFSDGIMDTYFDSEEEANKRKDELNKEVSTNKCVVKKESRKNIINEE